MGVYSEDDRGNPAQAETDARPPIAKIETNKGTIVVELYPDDSPLTVANFIDYAKSDFYQNTIFHRVVSGFMVQGGGYTADYEKKPTQLPIRNEANNGLQNLRGTVAMARSSEPHSATSQFFINISDNPFLDHRTETKMGWGYTVFGKVIEGMNVVETIQAVKTGADGPFNNNVPVEPIIIENVTVENLPEDYNFDFAIAEETEVAPPPAEEKNDTMQAEEKSPQKQPATSVEKAEAVSEQTTEASSKKPLSSQEVSSKQIPSSTEKPVEWTEKATPAPDKPTKRDEPEPLPY